MNELLLNLMYIPKADKELIRKLKDKCVET